MYSMLGIHFRRWAWLISPLASFMRIRIYPKSITKESIQESLNNKSVVYVLPRMSIIDTLVLNKALNEFALKKVALEAKPKRFRSSALMAIKTSSLIFSNSSRDSFLSDFVRLIRNDPRAKSEKLIFIPVSIFWSRAPERHEKSFFLRSLFPDDGTGNGLQKLFMLALHRGEVNISFGKIFHSPLIELQNIESNKTDSTTAIATQENTENIETEYENARKMRRLFNIEFAKERAAAFGPVLYDNEKISQWILNSQSTKNFIQSSDNPLKTEQQIVRYIREIGANYNYVTIRALEKVFDFIWTKIFEGVRVRNFEHIERVAKDGQILWMPSHRSHFDYLLLSYVLFKKGFVIPHIAAGINLNFWPIGSILRKGGAFFIRRSFAGNRIYAHTFTEYVNFLLQNSFPVEFFHEGGRSRIGKLLQPKVGMLSICVQSILTRKAENTYIVPVYFGYDKVMEDDTYAKELKGAKKQKENALQFLNGVRKVFSNYGSVDVSFGDPLRIGDIWREYIEKIKKESNSEFHIDPAKALPENLTYLPENFDARDPQVQGFVKYLSKRVNQKINGAATASDTSLLAACLLTSQEKCIQYKSLQFQVILMHYLINSLAKPLNWKISTSSNADNSLSYLMSHYQNNDSESSLISNTEIILSDNISNSIINLANQIFNAGERWSLMKKIKNNNNEFEFTRNDEKEMNLWWYRGTIFHILAPFGIIADILLSEKSHYPVNQLEGKMSSIRRIWQDDLYWDSKTSSQLITQSCLDIFVKLQFIKIENDLIILSKENSILDSLQFLSRIVKPEIELYGIQLATAIELVKEKGSFTRDELIQKTITTHSAAFLRTIAIQPPIFSKVFAQRTFESYFKAGVFIPHKNIKFSLDATSLNAFSDFLDVTLWSDFVP
ncbi:1-acyl-sn-glycerol-3-phosphate acyltransferase [Fluviispira sanaruensis]|uniref:Glycerol-3-phosphate acyltransferase n=1 Tax=Fluviispira sanaruensis TaxID=2493639 RepID=A0A4P2VKY8_FLUSA|nr:1-acyl-sn-glycerol-3-phosphate acyltransferase [Fluviispira sanaruensis]BBH52390.1 glycerol-3-phosphate acyltransferase [Fluviispira sanaruensis]